MNNLQGQMNPGTDATYRGFRAGLDAARVGTVATSVLFFAGLGVGDEGNGYEYSANAAQGSTLSITRTGLYAVSVRLQNATTSVVAGVTINTDDPGLTALPSYDVAGMQDLQFAPGADDSGIAAGLNLDAMVAIRGADLEAGVAAGNTGAVLRVHARTQADASPDGLVVGTASLFVRRVSPVF